VYQYQSGITITSLSVDFLLLSFCTFDQLITLKSFKSLLCVLIYRPANFHGDFIQVFSEFVSGILISFDTIYL